MTERQTWPSSYEYAMAHRCPTCHATPGAGCDAPRKRARRDRDVEAFGGAWTPDPAHLLHAARQDAGIRHYYRDLRKAPWPEEREPGKRYDTLGTAVARPPSPRYEAHPSIASPESPQFPEEANSGDIGDASEGGTGDEAAVDAPPTYVCACETPRARQLTDGRWFCTGRDGCGRQIPTKETTA